MNKNEVYFWDSARHGLPKSYADATSMISKLSAIEEEPSEAFLQLAEAMDTYLNNNPNDWFSGSFVDYARNGKYAVVRMEMPPLEWEVFFIAFVGEAQKLGVVVLSDFMRIAFLPAARVLPKEMDKAWVNFQKAWEFDGFPTTLNQFKKMSACLLEAMLARHGILKKARYPWGDNTICYSRKFDGIFQYFESLESAYRDDRGVYFMLNFWVSISSSHVSMICSKFDFVAPYAVFEARVFGDLLDQSEDKRQIRSIDDLVSVIYVIEKTIFPVLDICSSIKGVNAVLNESVGLVFKGYLNNCIFMPQCLIVAKLAGNPDFESLAISLSAAEFWGGNARVRDDEWPRLIKYLRDEVKPLEEGVRSCGGPE